MKKSIAMIVMLVALVWTQSAFASDSYTTWANIGNDRVLDALRCYVFTVSGTIPNCYYTSTGKPHCDATLLGASFAVELTGSVTSGQYKGQIVTIQNGSTSNWATVRYWTSQQSWNGGSYTIEWEYTYTTNNGHTSTSQCRIEKFSNGSRQAHWFGNY